MASTFKYKAIKISAKFSLKILFFFWKHILISNLCVCKCDDTLCRCVQRTEEDAGSSETYGWEQPYKGTEN